MSDDEQDDTINSPAENGHGGLWGWIDGIGDTLAGAFDTYSDYWLYTQHPGNSYDQPLNEPHVDFPDAPSGTVVRTGVDMQTMLMIGGVALIAILAIKS